MLKCGKSRRLRILERIQAEMANSCIRLGVGEERDEKKDGSRYHVYNNLTDMCLIFEYIE